MVLPTIAELDDENDGGMRVEAAPRSVVTWTAHRSGGGQGGARADIHHPHDLSALYRPRSLVQYSVEHAGAVAWGVSMLILLHLSFCVYALVGTARSGAFYEACGGALWGYAALRLVGGVLVGVVFLYMLYTPFADLGCWRSCVCALALAGHIVSFVVCVLLVRDAAARPTCPAAMADASYTNTPLLVIMCGALAAEDALRAAGIAFLLSLRLSVRPRGNF
jgi:hypothetical protein